MAKCKSCDREILWAATPKGKRIPLELCKHAYTVQAEFAEGSTVSTALQYTAQNHLFFRFSLIVFHPNAFFHPPDQLRGVGARPVFPG